MEPQSPSLFRQASRGIAASSGGDMLIKLAGFFSTAIILHHLAPYEYGLWQLLLSAVTAFSMPLFPSIAGMLVADASREIGAGRKVIANGILIRGSICFAALGTAAAVAMFIAAPFVTRTTGFQITFLLRLLATTLFESGIAQAYFLVLQTRLEFVHAQTMKVLTRASYLAGIVLFVMVLQDSLPGLVYAYVFCSFLPTILYTPYLIKLYRAMWKDRGEETWRDFFKVIMQRGPWVFGSDVVSALSGTLSPWIIGYFLGVTELGIISIALLFISQVSAFVPVSYVLRSILPRTVHEPGRMHYWLMRSMKYSLWAHMTLGVLAIIALVIIAPLYFPQYVAAIPLCIILSVTLIFRALGLVAIEWFYATRRQKELFIASSIPGVATLILLVPMLAFFGLAGYIANNIISSDILILLRLQVIQRYENLSIHWSDFFTVDKQDWEFLNRVYRGVRQRLGAFLPAR